MTHPAIKPGNVAVITGGASGIGLAAATRCAERGMNIVLADLNADALAQAKDSLSAFDVKTVTVPTDVSDLAAVQALKTAAYDAFGSVDVLMNNAGTAPGGGPFDGYDGWTRVLGVNLWGVVNGVQTFAPDMIAQGTPAAIVNTGSKQGITTPPGDTAYNVSKAGIKALTEGLQHTLRNTPGCQVTAHLLVPGFTFTGLTRRRGTEKPPGAWTPEQVVAFMLDGMGAGDFYLICPDNEVSREIDNARMTWAMQDITQNRPPPSRWHPDYQAAFAEFLAKETGGG